MILIQDWQLDVIKRLKISSFNRFDQLRADGYVPDDELRIFLNKLKKIGLIFYTGKSSVGTTKKGDRIFLILSLLFRLKEKLMRAQ